MISILFQIYLSALLITGLTGVVAMYINKQGPLYLRLLSWFILLILGVEKFANFWAGKYGSDHAIVNFFLIIQFLFYSFVLYNIMPKPAIKKWVVYADYGYLIIAIPLIFFVQGINHLNSIVYFIGGFILSFFSAYSLLELFRVPGKTNLFRTSSFYICCAILFYHCCTIPIIVPWTLLLHMTPFDSKLLHVLLTTVYCMSYVMFAIAFIFHFKNRVIEK
jgi:hypothetical protein